MATILSAQCTDERVNQVTPRLFERYGDAPSARGGAPRRRRGDRPLHRLLPGEDRSITGFARGLVERHGGEVPRTMAELVPLPGVGRKTANVVLGHAYGVNEGIAVDTHVLRVTNRLGLAEGDDPLEGRAAAHGPRPARALDADDRPRSSSTAGRCATRGGPPAASARSSRCAAGRAGRPGPPALPERAARGAAAEARDAAPARPEGGGAAGPSPRPAGAGRGRDGRGERPVERRGRRRPDDLDHRRRAQPGRGRGAGRAGGGARGRLRRRCPRTSPSSAPRASPCPSRRTSTARGSAGWPPSPGGSRVTLLLGSLPERVPGDARVRNTSRPPRPRRRDARRLPQDPPLRRRPAGHGAPQGVEGGGPRRGDRRRRDARSARWASRSATTCASPSSTAS